VVVAHNNPLNAVFYQCGNISLREGHLFIGQIDPALPLQGRILLNILAWAPRFFGKFVDEFEFLWPKHSYRREEQEHGGS
jgi:hypothetical protein